MCDLPNEDYKCNSSPCGGIKGFLITEHVGITEALRLCNELSELSDVMQMDVSIPGAKYIRVNDPTDNSPS